MARADVAGFDEVVLPPMADLSFLYVQRRATHCMVQFNGKEDGRMKEAVRGMHFGRTYPFGGKAPLLARVARARTT